MTKPILLWLYRQRTIVVPILVVMALLALCVIAAYGQRNWERYRAGIWAEELRKAGVTAPQVPK